MSGDWAIRAYSCRGTAPSTASRLIRSIRIRVRADGTATGRKRRSRVSTDQRSPRVSRCREPGRTAISVLYQTLGIITRIGSVDAAHVLRPELLLYMGIWNMVNQMPSLVCHWTRSRMIGLHEKQGSGYSTRLTSDRSCCALL